MPGEPVDLAALVPSWELALRAENKSFHTVRSYLSSARGFIRWCESNGMDPVLEKSTVTKWLAALLESGIESSTALTRQRTLHRFSAWLADEGEIDSDELQGMRPVKPDVKITPSLTDEQLRALIQVCKGPEFRDRRDEALIRLMAETTVRAGEVIAMNTADVNLREGLATVRRGKGGKGRVVPFGPQTARAIDRYLRARKTHRLAGTPALWLGERGKGFQYPALHQALSLRAEAADIPNFHPHVLRHTAASRWLARGGSEGGLMAVGGWVKHETMARYVAANVAERAIAEARLLGLGDL